MLVGQSAAGLGFMVSASCENMTTASSISSLITLPAILFGGLFVNTSTVTKFLSWIQWISPIRYGFECLCIAEFKPRNDEQIYEVLLGFGTKLGFLGCTLLLLTLGFVARMISVFVLKLNIKKF